jgi:predicted RNase H-like nuclease (RuvC/YqgF family)
MEMDYIGKNVKLQIKINELEKEIAKLESDSRTEMYHRVVAGTDVGWKLKCESLEEENKDLKTILQGRNKYWERMCTMSYNDAIDFIIGQNRTLALNDLSQSDLEKFLFSLKKK